MKLTVNGKRVAQHKPSVYIGAINGEGFNPPLFAGS